MQIAVVRGTVEELNEMGMENLIVGADLVVEVPGTDGTRIRDVFDLHHDIRYVQINTPEQVMAESFDRIKCCWEQSHPTDGSHLGHSAAGLWWFYWLSPQLEHMSVLLARGDVDGLRAAAGDYIDSGYGERRGPTLEQPQEEAEWKAATPDSSPSRT